MLLSTHDSSLRYLRFLIMLLRKQILVFFVTLLSLFGFSQQYQLGFGFTNNVTSWPVIGYPQLFYTRFHPGIEILLEKKINNREKNQFWADADLGCFYHRFFQTAVKLSGNIHYRYFFNSRIFSDVSLGGGYLHSFYQYQVFRLNSNGDYVKESGYKGRPQFIMGTSIGIGYGLKKSDPDWWRLLVQFRSNMQGIFAGSFVPVVPYNTFLIGLTHRINFKKNEKVN